MGFNPHLLLRPRQTPLSTLMQRLMTSYAVYYNRRHRRSGHLFQNRYKSIVCEEYRYFLVLVRYIHLNPMRSGLVESLKELERYPWCGDGVLMGRFQFPWGSMYPFLSCGPQDENENGRGGGLAERFAINHLQMSFER
jgi:hypothetical protein